MKLSEITVETVRKYLRLTEDEHEDDDLIDGISDAAQAFIIGYTDLTKEKADEISDLGYAFLCLCSDMYNTRDMVVQQDKLNPIAKCILDMHRTNCIG